MFVDAKLSTWQTRDIFQIAYILQYNYFLGKLNMFDYILQTVL